MMAKCNRDYFKETGIDSVGEKRNILIGCFILFSFLLFSLDSTFYGIYEINFFPQAGFMQIVKYVAIVLFVCLGIFYRFPVVRVKISVFKGTGMLLIFMLLAMVFNRDSGGMYFILAIACAFVFVNIFSFEEFIRIFRSLMMFISLISVLIHVFFSVFAFAYEAVTSVLSQQRFTSLILLKIISGCYGMGIMNAGFFRERGVFAIYLTLAVLFLLHDERDMKKNKRKSIFELLLYTAALVSTRGSTAILTFLMIFASLFINFIKRGRVPKYIMLLFIISMLLILCYLPDSLKLLLEKLNFNSGLADSGIARVASFLVPLKVAVANPFFGVGVDNFKNDYMQLSQMYIGYQSSSFTNTFTGLAAYFGLPYVLIVLYGFYKFSIKLKSGYLNKIIVFLLLLLQYFAQSEYCIAIFWILILFGFDNVLSGGYEKNKSING